MIDFLDGIIDDKSPTRVVLNVGGVGYEIFISLNCHAHLPDAGSPCRLLVHDHIREDQHVLFGFMTAEERRLFGLLLGVTGIGPKIAIRVMSGLSTSELSNAISGGDTARLSSISGVGRKTAERLVVELRDKLTGSDSLTTASGVPIGDSRLQYAARALMALGYKSAQAQKMVAAASVGLPADGTVEHLIRKALRR